MTSSCLDQYCIFEEHTIHLFLSEILMIDIIFSSFNSEMVQKCSQPYCLAKYMKLYIAACCYIKYERAAPSCGLLVYEQFSTVLKPIMTLVAEMAARWRCEHTYPDSGRTTFSRFLTKMILFWKVSSNFEHTYANRYHKI